MTDQEFNVLQAGDVVCHRTEPTAPVVIEDREHEPYHTEGIAVPAAYEGIEIRTSGDWGATLGDPKHYRGHVFRVAQAGATTVYARIWRLSNPPEWEMYHA